ncbi:MAG: glycoside hydrolase family 3 protein [Ignavibacteriae bacterium]|nr:glycoside hydrolase family 3 protein [Ignavibacteriota bacterium]
MPNVLENEYSVDEEYRENIHLLAASGIAGFCVFQGKLEETRAMIAALQTIANGTLLMSADYEYGLPMRLEGGTVFPQAMAIGKANDPAMTRKIAQAIAREARGIGIHWNFAPVCDVNSNPKNPIINIRSFGETPKAIIPHIIAMVEGMQSEGVIACAKHFPGHGDTSVDSHLSLPTLLYDIDRLERTELSPFRAAISAGVRSVMVAHLAAPTLADVGKESIDKNSRFPTNENDPASLSKAITTGFLKNILHFSGLSVTDALDMQSITRQYSSGEAAIRAMDAGADVILIPDNPWEAIEALAREAETNPLFAERLSQAAAQIEAAKKWCSQMAASLDPKPISLEEHANLALQVAKKAVRIEDHKRALPLSQYETFAAFAVMQDENIEPGAEFFHFLAQTVDSDCDFGFLDAAITDDEATALAEQTADAEIIVVAIFMRARSHKGTVDVPAYLDHAISLIADGRKVISVLLGNPYLRDAIHADCYISTYSDSTPAIGAAALALGGKLK